MKREEQVAWTLDYIYDITFCHDLELLRTITYDEKEDFDSLDKDLKKMISEASNNIRELIRGNQ